MRLNIKGLKKIMYDFNSLCNRLLQADFADYNGVLRKFIVYISETEIIHDYIVDCGECDQEMNQAFKDVLSREGLFVLGDTVSEEVRNIYAILKHIVDNNINVSHSIGMRYSRSNNFQEIQKDFNDRVVMVLIRHIEAYLTKVGIDMGIDDRIIYNITVRDGQINIANDNANISATNTVGSIDVQELNRLIDIVRTEANKSDLSNDNMEIINDGLDVISEEAQSSSPRYKIIKTAITGLKTVKGTAEFFAAVTALIQFFQPFFN